MSNKNDCIIVPSFRFSSLYEVRFERLNLKVIVRTWIYNFVTINAMCLEHCLETIFSHQDFLFVCKIWSLFYIFKQGTHLTRYLKMNETIAMYSTYHSYSILALATLGVTYSWGSIHIPLLVTTLVWCVLICSFASLFPLLKAVFVATMLCESFVNPGPGDHCNDSDTSKVTREQITAGGGGAR